MHIHLEILRHFLENLIHPLSSLNDFNKAWGDFSAGLLVKAGFAGRTWPTLFLA
jgi:hypothetical protein